MHNRWLLVILIALLGLLQARLWFGKNSIADYNSMKSEVEELQTQNANLKQRNALLQADISDLHLGLESM